MRRLASLAEVWLAALVLAASCVVHPDAPVGHSREGTVVDVRRYISDEGEPMVRLTVSTQEVTDEGMLYENNSIVFPATSREAVLFGHRGACAQISRWGDEIRLTPCN